jgi:hypothetical protein|nr:MAG TPA: hypothetical protein [Caudoviricetes sp.]
MTETKRDVVEAILLAKDTDTIWDSSNVRYYFNRYDNALPDDLPVIPEAVSDHIKESMENDLRLDDALMSVPEKFNYVKELISGYAFYRAWVLGVWRVEETGEIVKLEAEK